MDFIRPLLSQAEEVILARVAARTGAAVLGSVQAAGGNLMRRASELMALLARLPHSLANKVANGFRGPLARPLTSGEIRLVTEAHGSAVDPADVCIVRGPGLSPAAATAFLNGNPAITIGQTIFLKPDYDVNFADLSTSPVGAELVVYEFTHVVQYATLGFGVFGVRYAAELATHHGRASELYDYKHRNFTYPPETLEGEADMVGNFRGARADPTAKGRELEAQIRRKLAGTGIYGN